MTDFEQIDPKTATWEQLMEYVSSENANVGKSNWLIFHYLQQNYKTVGSLKARTLLALYMKTRVMRSSLVDSCMLGMAVKISETYADFKLPKFLEAWGYDACLRDEDLHRDTGKDGRQYLSLKERVDRALQTYLLHHPDENTGECEAIVSMYAVKVFEKEVRERKCRYVKLVGGNGSEFIADSHQFPCRPWEISGRMFDVLTRVSKQGKERAAEIVVSRKRVEEVFPAEVGYVDYIDDSHGHIHIYDSQSRHFVAEKQTVAPRFHVDKGGFVSFCPIIVNGDHFKSAAVIGVMDKGQGLRAFGTYDAKVDNVNREDCYIHYTIESEIKPTPEGEITQSGFASTAALPDDVRNGICAGAGVRLLLFLKRGKDGAKHNYVADIRPAAE